jgi:hypothetical protein
VFQEAVEVLLGGIRAEDDDRKVPSRWLGRELKEHLMPSDSGRVVRKCLVLAYEVHESGYREVIGLDYKQDADQRA